MAAPPAKSDPEARRAGARDVSCRPIRLMMVDDSLTARTVIARVIEGEPDIVTVAQASTAEAALAMVATARPDVILLDLEMPGMGGLRALPRLLGGTGGVQILVVSSFTEAGARHTLEALAAGAADTLLKPRPGDFDASYRRQLLGKIRALGRRSGPADPAGPQTASAPILRRRGGKTARVIAIGASTGGVHAIGTVLRGLPESCDLPILITQHIPASFVPVLARQLQLASGRPTVVAEDGTPLTPGRIVLAPGHAHLLARRRGTGYVAALGRDPAPSGCCPAVDTMLGSVAEAYEGGAVALILSGMGRDGLAGARTLAEAGGTVIAQDSASSAVWGMPKAVVTAGLAAAVLSPEQMPHWLTALPGPSAWT